MPGCEVHGPFDTEQAARAWISERAKRWSVSPPGNKKVQ